MASGHDLKNWFSYHAPVSVEQSAQYDEVRAGALVYAEKLAKLCPAGHELEVALDRLREVMYWANAGIACVAPSPAVRESHFCEGCD